MNIDYKIILINNIDNVNKVLNFYKNYNLLNDNIDYDNIENIFINKTYKHIKFNANIVLFNGKYIINDNNYINTIYKLKIKSING